MSEPLKMDPAIRDRWVARLRSGEIPQLYGELGRDSARCCLGVLCDIAVEDKVIVATQLADGSWSYDDGSTVLPPAVIRWAGLKNADPCVVARPDDCVEYEYELTSLNDDHDWTFPQIADAIEGKSS